MPPAAPVPAPADPAALLAALGSRPRVVLVGDVGSGKSTLSAALADALAASGAPATGICADPGQPAFGPPGAASLAARRGGAWHLTALEGLATLDAGRYRLPLIEAVRRLAAATDDQPLVLDAPGVARGAPAAELLPALVGAAGATHVLALTQDDAPLPVAAELLATPATVLHVRAAAAAAPRPPADRVTFRTAAWDAWLTGARPLALPRLAFVLAGRPALGDPAAWPGRQVALLDASGATLTLAQVVSLAPSHLHLLSPPVDPARVAVVLVRDAGRAPDATLATRPWPSPRPPRPPPPRPGARPDLRLDLGPPPADRVTRFAPAFLGGLWDDPTLHLRHDLARRGVLFDLGDLGALPAKLVHQLSDVFVTHAHMDHFSGMLALLRRRLGATAPCRLYGPPGLAARVAAAIAAFTWDRIGDDGPRFHVAELHDATLRWTALQPGRPAAPLPDTPAPAGQLLADRDLTVRAAPLDHAGLPVLAFALRERDRHLVRPDRLAAAPHAPGPWVGALVAAMDAGAADTLIRLPDGASAPAARLAADLLTREPGQTVAYATDLGDTPSNRAALIALARGADLLVCEASFAQADAPRAARTGHLTARACGEIAAAAAVRRLAPFHPSHRYEADPAPLYAEVRAAFSNALAPTGLDLTAR